MSLDIKTIFEEDMTEEEMVELLQYSSDDSTLVKRYMVACQIISNMTSEDLSDVMQKEEVVDLTICKMLVDGVIQVEEEEHSIH
jgi:hypothetical protein|tara:strand:- start:610 stop:861 length:252 start_codon:yes stop_codon:yes gene_type:complete